METAIFAAGCFWGIEAAFRRVPGVTETEVGYTGGTVEDPSYEDVCSGRTGHAEAVRITFDPAQLSYRQLLDVFWSIHDPTTVDRQGPDVGSQYRSAIFVRGPEQEAAARAACEKLQASGRLRHDVVTEVTPASAFYRAEEYHQRYLETRGAGPHGGP